jgi:hypothetical protein
MLLALAADPIEVHKFYRAAHAQKTTRIRHP